VSITETIEDNRPELGTEHCAGRATMQGIVMSEGMGIGIEIGRIGVIVGTDKDGTDSDGTDNEGIDNEGIDKDGMDKDGMDKDGMDKDGMEIDGMDKDGRDRDGKISVGMGVGDSVGVGNGPRLVHPAVGQMDTLAFRHVPTLTPVSDDTLAPTVKHNAARPSPKFPRSD
jgi:hypothetical protein